MTWAYWEICVLPDCHLFFSKILDCHNFGSTLANSCQVKSENPQLKFSQISWSDGSRSQSFIVGCQKPLHCPLARSMVLYWVFFNGVCHCILASSQVRIQFHSYLHHKTRLHTGALSPKETSITRPDFIQRLSCQKKPPSQDQTAQRDCCRKKVGTLILWPGNFQKNWLQFVQTGWRCAQPGFHRRRPSREHQKPVGLPCDGSWLSLHRSCWIWLMGALSATDY